MQEISQTIIYATSNQDKLNNARSHLLEFGISVEQKSLDLQEIQSFDGRQIALDKAQEAFEILHQPVLVSDDSWSIPALNGFPGPYMKQANHYFKGQNWLDLMQHESNKKIILTAHIAFADESGIDVFSLDRELEFLDEIDGHHDTSQILTVVRRLNSQHSVAVDLMNGEYSVENERELWESLVTRMRKSE